MLEHVNNFVRHENVLSDCLVQAKLDTKPLLSIMIPTYIRPEYLEKAIRSAIDQKTSFEFEVCVVDNGTGTDGADQVLQVVQKIGSPRVSLYRNRSNIGMFGNWNRCIELASAARVSILNDDDLLAPDFVERILGAMQDQSVRFCAVPTRIDDQRKHSLSSKAKAMPLSLLKKAAKACLYRYPRKLSLSDYFISNPNMGSLGIVFYKGDALTIGGFSENLYPHADYVFFAQLVSLVDVMWCFDWATATYVVSINETGKNNVIEQMAEGAALLRGEILSQYERYPKYAKKYIGLASFVLITRAGRSWGMDIDSEKWELYFGCNHRFAYLRYHVHGFLMRLFKSWWVS